MKRIKISILNRPGEYIDYSTSSVECLMMTEGDHRTVENLLSFCAGCDMMQKCKPWLKVDDISRDDFEAAGQYIFENESEAQDE